MAKNFKDGKRKSGFLESIPTSSIEESDVASRSKFNFSYFDDSQPAGQGIEEWSNNTGLVSSIQLFNKIKNFTRESLEHWANERCGAGNLNVLEVYPCFPKKTDFKLPVYIPHDVQWARFRLGNKVRLVGFVIPAEADGHIITIKNREYRLDSNTFYVVFLDKDHKFYKTEAK